MKQDENLAIAYGKTKLVTVPSGRKFLIREQNGADDDILSNHTDVQDMSNVNKFIVSITLHELVDNNKVPLTLESIQEMLLRDRNALLVESRIHTLGPDMLFKYDWGKNGGILTYQEDLTQYVWDYSRPFPNEELDSKGNKDVNYNENRLKPYPTDIKGPVEFELSSGKVISIDFLRVKSESYFTGVGLENINRNHDYRGRDLKLKVEDGSFMKVENFSPFSKRDMIEIRKFVKEFDPTQGMNTEISNGKGDTIFFPLLASTDFFFPEEV